MALRVRATETGTRLARLDGPKYESSVMELMMSSKMKRKNSVPDTHSIAVSVSMWKLAAWMSEPNSAQICSGSTFAAPRAA